MTESFPQTSAVDIPQAKDTHVLVQATSDGNATLTSIMTDAEGNQTHHYTETGISPTYYYTSGGSMIHDTHHVGSPVYGDQSRIFFSHHSSCSCRGSGVGCECTKKCSC
ncbi:uncharacterized protein B0P05DRAFT_540547 [Gilbertella persicaria]|uniref:uncharacterized protein n=1 Tax=Gilbertella persicaria TaxID=101096 RepID=UPI00222069D1|nr:uncharacterized protein B0P05DRAFT_540547 [Gilbertella persicaria]KAI8080248.1 hypothetical protein B0P05DRAFT_540547 [Gilbertella persicaria]